MNLKDSILLLIILPALFMSSCEKGFFAGRPEVTETIVADRFTTVILNSIFEVELKNDSLYSIQLTGPENNLENISAYVSGNTLEFTDHNSLRWLPDYPVTRVLISFPDLDSLIIKAPSRIRSRDTLRMQELCIISETRLVDADLKLAAEKITLETMTDDYGNYTLSGFARSARFRVFGSAQVQAGGLLTETAHVSNYSIGDIYIRVTRELTVMLGHYGNIYYRGSPDVITVESRKSTGRLINLE